MTNESLTKIVDAIFEKYERAEVIQLIIELLQDRNVPYIPQITWGTDSNGSRIKTTRDFTITNMTNMQRKDLKGVEENLGQ